MPVLAILDTDTPFPAVHQKYGLYHDIFEKLLVTGGLDKSKWTVQGYDVVTKQEYPEGHVDALLLTGSKHNSYEDQPWILRLVEYTRKALASDVRILGICFGHQIVARALGAEVGVNSLGWEISGTEVDLSEVGQKIFGKPSITIMQMHRDIVKQVPEGTLGLGRTGVCEVQGLYKKSSFISVQGHPEFNEEIVKLLVNGRHASGVFKDEQAAKALKHADKPNDGPLIAQKMVDFINKKEDF